MDFPLRAFLAVQGRLQVEIESSDDDDDNESNASGHGEISMDSEDSSDSDGEHDDSYMMYEFGEESLVQVNHGKIMSVKFMLRKHDWEDPQQRKKIYRLICPIFRHWRGDLPNLRTIFEPTQIQWFLVLAARDRLDRGKRFCEFVARTGYKDQLEFRGQNGQPLGARRNTPVHFAKQDGGLSADPELIAALFDIYDRRDVNYVDQQENYTHFHAACEAGLYEVVEKFLDNGVDPNLTGYEHPPLYCAIKNDRAEVVKLLLRRGADPNANSHNGWTALHISCFVQRYNGHEVAKSIFELSQDRYKPLKIDAKDAEGRTALHLALLYGSTHVAELLLRQGADPRLADNDGKSPLHLCFVQNAEMMFRVCQELGKQLKVDPQDRYGKTPLQYAVAAGQKEEVKLLLSRGAKANFVSRNGSTMLHTICEKIEDDGLAKIFFDEAKQTINVNAKDRSGRTPLDLAVKNLLPNVVELLLARGADLASFVFPTELKLSNKSFAPSLKLRVGSGALGVYENLIKRGYEMKLNEALVIMNLFVKYELFATWDMGFILGMATADEECEVKARKISIKPDLTLYDWMQMPDKHRVDWSDGYKLVGHEDDALRGIEKVYRTVIEVHLCETISRGFFRKWAELCFQELMSKRWQLPIEVCEMIVGHLDNRDLCNICLAVELERNSK